MRITLLFGPDRLLWYVICMIVVPMAVYGSDLSGLLEGRMGKAIDCPHEVLRRYIDRYSNNTTKIEEIKIEIINLRYCISNNDQKRDFVRKNMREGKIPVSSLVMAEDYKKARLDLDDRIIHILKFYGHNEQIKTMKNEDDWCFRPLYLASCILPFMDLWVHDMNFETFYYFQYERHAVNTIKLLEEDIKSLQKMNRS